MACQLLEVKFEFEKEYEEFIKTDKGKDWIKNHEKDNPNFDDYFHDFYPELSF